MGITAGAGTTNFSNAGTDTPSVTVPSGAANGDWLYALLEYSGDAVPAAPAGWTEVSAGAFLSVGRYSLVRRQMASGVTVAQWTLPPGEPSYAKMTAAMFVVKGADAQTVGAVTNRAASGTTTVLPQVTVPTGGILLAFAAERTSSQTTVTAPAGMTEAAKYISGGGGGGSVLIAYQLPTAGASGARTVTYAVASPNAAGLLVTLAPATGSLPSVSAGSAATMAAGVNRAFSAGSPTATGADTVAWTKQSGPAVTINSPTSLGGANITPTTPGVYVFRLSATNTNGTTSDDVTITVTGTTVSAAGVVINPGGYTPIVSATVEEAVADASDTTWAESASAGASITFQLAPVAARPGYTVRTRMKFGTAATGNVLVELLQGATLIASSTHAVTTSLATFAFPLDAGQVASITNTADLRLRVTRQ